MKNGPVFIIIPPILVRRLLIKQCVHHLNVDVQINFPKKPTERKFPPRQLPLCEVFPFMGILLLVVVCDYFLYNFFYLFFYFEKFLMQ